VSFHPRARSLRVRRRAACAPSRRRVVLRRTQGPRDTITRHGNERTLRSEQAERSRERLLDAAAEEFWLHGLAGSRIQDVLDRAEMTKGGLYHHFTTKQELADALFLTDGDCWVKAADRVSSSGQRGLAAVRAYIAELIATMTTNVRARALVRIGNEIAVDGQGALEQWRAFFMRCLQQSIADAEVADDVALYDLATTLADCVLGVVALPESLETAGSSEARAARLWALVGPGLTGFRAP
jgi:AcrR family transcriptional regulator